MNFLLRFGQIGDIITAVEASKELNAELLACESKKIFFSNKNNNNYMKIIESLSESLGQEIKFFSIFSLKKIILKETSSRIYIMTQSLTFTDRLFSFILSAYIGKKVEILYEGTQTFFGSLERGRNLFITKVRSLINSPLLISIVWDGKEKQKNLNASQIKNFIDIISNSFNDVKINILGKNNILIDSKTINNISGATSLNEAMKIIDNSDIIISVDTGLLHYAVHKNKPTIAIIAHRLELANWFPASGPTALISSINSENRYCCIKSCNNCILNKEINSKEVSNNLKLLLNQL